MSQVQLKASSIFDVPLQSYNKDFTFVVNGEEFLTSKVQSDLLSSKISRIHKNDPTFDIITINTESKGNFSNFIQLSNFEKTVIPENEIEFMIEIIEKLGNEHIEITNNKETKITMDNVFDLLKKHKKNESFYRSHLSSEIDYISSHFYEIIDTHEDEFVKLDIDTINSILEDDKLVLNNEDQLLKFVNQLYEKDSNFSILYEQIIFKNVSPEAIKEFVLLFNYNDMNKTMWISLCKRLETCNNLKENLNLKRYKNERNQEEEEKKYENENINEITIPFTGNNEFKGIINYIRNNSNQNINDAINVTSSSVYPYDNFSEPRYAVLFEEQNKSFHSNSSPNSWFCIDFKKYMLNPTNYTIKSSHRFENNPKSWAIEGSNDHEHWEIIDEQTDCSLVKERNSVHTFQMNQPKSKEFRYIRMRSTGPSWSSGNFLFVNSIEFYGKLTFK